MFEDEIVAEVTTEPEWVSVERTEEDWKETAKTTVFNLFGVSFSTQEEENDRI